MYGCGHIAEGVYFDEVFLNHLLNHPMDMCIYGGRKSVILSCVGGNPD